MSTVARALSIATEAHAGQMDKGGAPYLTHPLRVAASVPPGEAEIVALLHDVVEDSPWTLEQLRAEGFSETVLAGVEAMTRREGETYPDFVRRASADPLGRVVKLADLRDNLDPARLAKLTPERRAKAETKYREALKILALPPGRTRS